MKRLALIGSGLVVATTTALLLVFPALGDIRGAPQAPFAYDAASGTDSGPVSGLWGDGSSGPSGIELGCIPGRRYGMAIVVHNQTEQAVTILRVGGVQRHVRVIKRVAVQARPKQPENGEARSDIGLRSWSRTSGQPLTVPAGSDAWLQLNFLMGRCSLINPSGQLVVSDRLAITYQDSSGATDQEQTPRVQRLILTRASKAAITAYRRNPEAG